MTTTHISAAEVEKIGHGLFGPTWKAELARRMGRTFRTITRWSTDGANLEPADIADLARIVEERRVDLDAARVAVTAALFAGLAA